MTRCCFGESRSAFPQDLLRPRHVPRNTLDGCRIAPPDISLRRLADELVDAALCEPRGDRHVVATQRVAQRPRVHKTVTHSVSIGNLILRATKLMHMVLLNLKPDAGDRPTRSQPLVGKAGVAMLFGHEPA